MMWKKAIALSCAFLAAGGLTGCGGTTGVPHREDKAAGASSETHMVKKDAKAIVVYFSATGNTKRAAEIIAKTKGADLWEIKAKEPYSEADLDYRSDTSRVSREHKDRSILPEIDGDVPSWDSYQTVFLGYPIWWGIAAWPVDAFVKANDFSGKTVVTFATAASSPLGNSGKLLAEMAGGKGSWQDGTCFTGSLSDAKVTDWLKSLKLSN